MNLLKNSSFELPLPPKPEQNRCLVMTPDPAAGQPFYYSSRGEINNPQSWTSWYVHDGRAPDYDPGNGDGWCEPETRQAPHAGRQHEGLLSHIMFTFTRIHHGGFYQQVSGVTVGDRLRAGYWAHAWTGNSDDPTTSEGVGNADYFALEGEGPHNQVVFWVGIDPTGGTDPFAASVVWGQGAHIYNKFHEIPNVEAVALASTVTVFTRERFRWRFKHCDGYTDSAFLEVVADVPEPPVIPPSVDYDYPCVETGTKLTLHANGEGGTYDLLRYLMAHGYMLPFVKVLATNPDQVAAVANLKALSPGTRFVCRLMSVPGSGVNIEGPDFNSDPAAYMDALLPTMLAHPEVDYWETWNEQDPPNHLPMMNFACECMDIAADNGIKLAIPSYSSGVPENDEWQMIYDETPFFELAHYGGHILSLHAYCHTGNPESITYHLLRPQWLYENILLPHNCVVPFLFTEYNIDDNPQGAGITNWNIADLLNEYRAVDELLAEMFYCLGACLFTFGLGGGTYTLNNLWQPIAEMMLEVQGRQNALPPESTGPPAPGECPVPREDFHCVYVLIPPGHGWEWFAVLRPAWEVHYFTVGGSADHAAYIPGISKRTVLALNPTAWPGDLAAFFNTYYPNTTESMLEYIPIEAATPADWLAGIQAYYGDDPIQILDVRSQMAINPSSPWYPWKQRTLAEITHVFVHHSAGVTSSNLETVKGIAVYHTSPNGKNRPGVCYTYTIGADGTIWYVSNIENVVFSQGVINDLGDENRWGVGVCLLGCFINGNKPTTAQLDSLTALINCLNSLTGKILAVWGHKDVDLTNQCPGDSWPFKPEWGRLWPPSPPSPSFPAFLGFNDHPGPSGTASEWMRANGVQGLVVRPIFLGGSGTALDFAQAAAAGQRVIVNLRYSWSVDKGGAGTLPKPGTPEWTQFVLAAIFTINASTVWGWEIGNEYNNPREFPRAGALTPAGVAQTYNAIRAGTPGKRLAPGALDPFNAQAGDPRDWLTGVYGAISGAEFVTAHGYIRGPDANLVGSTAKFADAPLQWQFLNYPGCVTALLANLPTAYKNLPVYITEFNHLWKTIEPDWGWVTDARAATVVERAFAAASAAGFSGLALYRWAGDEWETYNKGLILDAVKRLV